MIMEDRNMPKDVKKIILRIFPLRRKKILTVDLYGRANFTHKRLPQFLMGAYPLHGIIN